jgi:hypothetical protein
MSRRLYECAAPWGTSQKIIASHWKWQTITEHVPACQLGKKMLPIRSFLRQRLARALVEVHGINPDAPIHVEKGVGPPVSPKWHEWRVNGENKAGEKWSRALIQKAPYFVLPGPRMPRPEDTPAWEADPATASRLRDQVRNGAGASLCGFARSRVSDARMQSVSGLGAADVRMILEMF